MEKSLSVDSIADRMETASVTDSDGGASSDYRASERALTSVEALLEKDAHDESLRRYKEQLLGSAAHGDRGGSVVSTDAMCIE